MPCALSPGTESYLPIDRLLCTCRAVPRTAASPVTPSVPFMVSLSAGEVVPIPILLPLWYSSLLVIPVPLFHRAMYPFDPLPVTPADIVQLLLSERFCVTPLMVIVREVGTYTPSWLWLHRASWLLPVPKLTV